MRAWRKTASTSSEDPGQELFDDARKAHFARTDRLFGVLMLLQYFAGILASVVVSPRTWIGTTSAVHIHVWAAIFLGFAINVMPIFLALTRAGHTTTRYAIAVGQMLQSALLIHLSGGRIETHFHIFGSLAFLSLYRDWRVLVPATLVVLLQHVTVGWIHPQSLYGVSAASPWRWMEHTGWVLFEDVILVIASVRSEREMRKIAAHTAAVGESEERIRAVIATAMDAVITLDPKGKIIGWNSQAEPMFGWTAEEAIGRQFSELIVPAAARSLHNGGPAEFISSVQNGSKTRRFDMMALYRSGTEFPVELSISSMRSGKEYLFSAFIRDISERKRHENEMRTARDAAESANQAKSAFLANMSHEIRTPMTAILGYSDLLLMPESTQSDKIDSLQVIRRNAHHLLQLINDILDVSKIEAGKMTVEKLPTEVAALVGEVVSMMRPRISEKELELKVLFEGPIPRSISTDALRLRQILTNLLSNSTKFTARGSITLRISCDRSSTPPKMLFDVMDTGIGLTPEQLGRLFQPFTQADQSTTRRFGGSGLGLTICRRLSELLGGTVTVSSQYMLGSTFHVTIDPGALDGVEMLTNLTEASLCRTEDELIADALPKLYGEVLLAEDGPDNQVLISMYLRKAGATVTIADNGRVAVNMCKTKQFDLILMDMQMPEMDGYSAASELRRRGSTTPIIALTAHAMTGDRAKCIDAGCTEYLTKPIDRNQLIRLCNTFLEHCKPPALDAMTPAANDHSIAADSPAAGIAIIDEPVIAAVKSVEVVSEEDEMTTYFISKLPERVDGVRKTWEEGNLEELRRLSHQLKGAGGSFGFDDITTVAHRLEHSVDAAVRSGTQVLEEQLRKITSDVRDLVETVRGIKGYPLALETYQGKAHAPARSGH